MIQLTDTLFYNSELPLDEQPEVFEYITEVMTETPTETLTEPAGHYPRITKQVWEKDMFTLRRDVVYKHPGNHPSNGLMESDILTITLPEWMIDDTVENLIPYAVQSLNFKINEAYEKAREVMASHLLNAELTEEEIQLAAPIYPQWNELTNFYGPNNPDHPITIFTYEGKLYKTLQDHQRHEDWLPTAAVSLYVEITPPGVIPAWKPPQGAHDAWPLGVQVTHNGHLWESGIDNNSTVPGENPGHDYWIDLGVWAPQEPGDPEPPANPCDSIVVWDSTQDWNSYVTGELRKWEIDGVMKVFSCNSKEWAYIEPGQPYSGWKYEYDCPA